MRYTLTALVLALAFNPLKVFAQEASTAVVVGTNPGLVISTPTATVAEDSEAVKHLRAQQEQEFQAFTKKQAEEQKAFIQTIVSKTPKEQRKLYNQFQQQQGLSKAAFSREQRAKTYQINIKRHEERMADQRRQMAEDKKMPEAAKKALLDKVDSMARASMEKQYTRMEEAETEYDKVRYDYSLKPEKRRKKLEEIRKKLAERNG